VLRVGLVRAAGSQLRAASPSVLLKLRLCRFQALVRLFEGSVKALLRLCC
jgi:hypothetical protein